MAVYGGQVQAINTSPDYGPSVAAARDLAMTQAQGVAGAVGQVADYFKQQGEKKKLIKQSDVQIDAALKLFPDLAPALQGYRDQLKDENLPLDERTAIADSISNVINMGISEMRNARNMLVEQQKLGLEQQYKAAQLGLQAEKVDIARQQAAKGPAPKFEIRKPQITSPTGEVFEGPELPYDVNRGMFFDTKAQKYISDPNLIGTGKEYAPDSAMPSQTSQVGGGSADLIANAARLNIGKLSTAKTPGTQGGNVGCADAICRTFKQATGEELVPGGTLSTREMATTLENDQRFVKVPLGQAQKGDIVLTPRKGNKAGHTGIVLDGGAIASNSSKGFAGKAPGTFVQNYTIDSWKRSVAPRNPSETAAYRYVGSQGIDNALSMGGDMTQQAMGTPQQQAMLSQQIEQGAGLATAQNSRQGAMPTEPSIATQQPQLPQQAAPQWTPPPGFAPKRGKFRDATAEEIARYGTQGQVNLETGEFRPIRPPSGMVIEQTPGGGFRVVQGAGVGGRQEQAAQEREKQQSQRAIFGAQDAYRALREFDAGVMKGSGVLASAYRKGAKFIPGTPEYKVAQDLIAPLEASIAKESIDAMRASSPTGAALGNSSDKDVELMKSKYGSLKVESDPETWRQNLNRFIEAQLDITHGTSEQRRQLLQDGKITKEQYFEIESQYPAFTMSRTGETVPRQMPQSEQAPAETEAERILRELGE